MKKQLSISLFIASICTLGVTPIKADITAATYNVLHGGSKGWFSKEGNWLKRQPGVCSIIKNMKADVYGLQEVVADNNQLADIEKVLSGYKYIGQPRNSSITGISAWYRFITQFATDDYNPIFYNTEKLDLVDKGTFGINENNTWHHRLIPRICTWALFKEKTTEKEFYTYNTHLDNGDAGNRIIQIKHVLDDIKQRCDNKPVILMGDLNTTFTGDMQKTLSTADFTHARTMVKDAPQYITTHLKTGKPFEIDHILVKPASAFTIKTYNICGERSETTSDHNPVCMSFSLN